MFYDPVYAGFIDRDLATATTTVRGGTAFGIYPFNRYRRVEFSGGLIQYEQRFNDPSLQELSQEYQQEQFGQQLFQTGYYVPLGVSYVQETTVFREFGPLSGNTMRLRYEVAPKIGDALDRQTADVDARFYQRIGGVGAAGAARARLQELGRRAGLHVLRRQLRDARLRIPRVRGQPVGLPQRRTALPAASRRC